MIHNLSCKLKFTFELMVQRSEFNRILEILSLLLYTHFIVKVLVHLISKQSVIILPVLSKPDTVVTSENFETYFSS